MAPRRVNARREWGLIRVLLSVSEPGPSAGGWPETASGSARGPAAELPRAVQRVVARGGTARNDLH
jgi:hypothetical protein